MASFVRELIQIFVKLQPIMLGMFLRHSIKPSSRLPGAVRRWRKMFYTNEWNISKSIRRA